jgi:hypothetical protein
VDARGFPLQPAQVRTALFRQRHQSQPASEADQPGGRNRPSGKDRTPLLLRSLASQHFDDGAAPAPRRRRP